LMLARPLGLLRVFPVRAAGLQGLEWEEAGEATSVDLAADAFIVVKTADERWESTRVEATTHPEWPEDEFGDLLVYDHEQRLWASVFDHAGSETSDYVGSTLDISLAEALSRGGPLVLYSREHVHFDEGEDAAICGELTLDFKFLEFVPGELCGDKNVLCVKVDTVSLPYDCSGHAQLRARLGEVVKTTPIGHEATEHEGSLVVSDLLRDVIHRSNDKGLSVDDIADITALDPDNVAEVLDGGEVEEQAVVAKTRRLVHLDSCLFLLVDAALLDSEEAPCLELTIADRKGQALSSTAVPLSQVAEAEEMTLTDIHEMQTEEGGDVSAHVVLTLMGTHVGSLHA